MLARQVFDKALVAGRVKDLCEKTGNVYYIRHTGNEAIDKFRPHIAELLGTAKLAKKSVKKSDVLQHCQKAVGQEIPMTIYSKIMKELASSRGAIWVCVVFVLLITLISASPWKNRLPCRSSLPN